jgi:putative ABC transport system permease protein
MTDQEIPEMGQHEAVLVTQDKGDMSSFSLGGQEYTVKDTKTTISRGDQYMADMMSGFYYIVVNDKASLDEIYQIQKSAYGENSSSYTYNVQIDIDGSKSEKIACGEAVSKAIDGMSGNYKSIYSECRDAFSDNFHHLYGGLFFLGLFLGTMFLMITVLIIFYKQISEGYDDKERFAIMEKVGMSSGEVKATISSQVKIVFFLPIVTAAIHVAAAFPMVRRLLAVLNLTNTALFAGCLAGTIVVFAIIYLIVFLLTSKTYYKIVGEQV